MDNSRIDFLYLSEQDMIKAGVLDMTKCISSMEDMFQLVYQGDYRMGGEKANEHGIRVSFPITSEIKGMPVHKPDYRFMSMPAYLGGRFHMFGVKNYGSNPDNINHDLPRSILMMSLLDADTGVPLAYMSANILSAMRTGAVCGVGAKHLCIKEPKTVGIIGPGTMSRYSIKAFMKTQASIENVKIKGRGKTNIKKFIEYCKVEYPQIKKIEECETFQEVCLDADILFYGTTNASKFERNPRVKYEWLKKGALVISASALLVSTDFLALPDVKLISDNYEMYNEWGAGQLYPTQKNVSTLLGMGFYDAVTEGKIRQEQITDIGEIISGKKNGRDNEEQIILYAVGGMPIEDVAWGFDVYKNALKNKVGISLNLWDKSAL